MVQGTQVRRLAVGVSVVILCSFAASRSRAHPARNAYPAALSGAARSLTARQKRLARQAVRQAIRLLRLHRYERSIAVLEAAYRRWHRPSFLFNMAVVLAVKGDVVDAVRMLRRYRKQVPGQDSKLPGPLRAALGRVGVLVVRAPSRRISIYLNGKMVGKGSIEEVLQPGIRTVELRQGSVVLKQKEIHIEAGKAALWEVDVLPRHATTRSVRAQRASTGLQSRARSGQTAHVGVTSGNGPSVHRPSRSGLHWAYFASVAGLALAGLGAAVGLSVKTRSLYGTFGNDRTNEDLAARGARYQNAANAMWGVTGALAIAAGVLAVFTRWKPDRREHSVTLQPTGGGARLSVAW